MRTSPESGQFHIECEMKSVEEGRKTIAEAEDMLDFYKSVEQQVEQQQREIEQTAEWKKDNLEYDLRSSDWIAEKCKEDYYAQNLYAALCNNDFTRNDVWPLLQGKSWSCSWRHAGGVVADIRQEGDYINWYCSGINGNDLSEDEFNNLTTEVQERYIYCRDKYVSEGIVTDEIRNDLLKLGWVVVTDNEDLG